MKKTSFLAWILAVTTFLPACGKFHDLFGRLKTTKVTVGGRRSGLAPFAVLNGGMLVYALKDDGNAQSIFLPDETQPATLNLPNGNYAFTAVGWDLATLTGTPRCGDAGQTYSLTGTDTDVTIDMNPANCTTAGNPYFNAQSYSGSTEIPLQLVFCAPDTNLGSMTYSSDCSGGLESSMFAKGNSSATIGEGDYFPYNSIMVYVANPVSLNELYATTVGSDGTDVVRLSPPPPAGSTGVISTRAIPNTNKGLFIMNMGSSAGNALFLYDLSTLDSTQISQTLTGRQGVQEFRIAPDGSYVVFVSDAAASGQYDLYSVPLAGPTYPAPARISATQAGMPGIHNCGSCTGDHRWDFDINPDSTNPFVVYSAAQASSTTTYNLFIASLTGATVAASANICGAPLSNIPSGTAISCGEVPYPGGVVDSVRFTYDSRHLIYHVNYSTQNWLYSIDTTYNTTASTLTASAPNSITSNSPLPWTTPGNASTKVIYFTNVSSQLSAHVVDLANPSSTNKGLQNFTTPEQGVAATQFSPDDNTVFIVTQNSSMIPIHLLSLTTNPTGNFSGVTYTDYSGLLSGSQKIYSLAKGKNNNYFTIDNSNTYLIYSSDQNTAGNVELFYSTIGTNGASAISGTGITSSANSVNSFTVTPGGIVYFSASIDIPGRPEIYSTTLTAGPTPIRIGSGYTLGNVSEVSANPTGDGLFIKAAPHSNASALEGWIYDIANNSYTEVTRFPDGSPSGLGRVMVSLMTYDLGGDNPVPAIQSTCMGYLSGSSDGGVIQDPVKTISVPTGLGGGTASPFVVAVDVFPLATSCTGPSVRYLFKDGIANPVADGTSALVGDSSSVLRLFINE
jgi:WD40-like Beta Propeller Repeat